MSYDTVTCLFCQTKNDTSLENCSHCGMALAKNHPEGKAKISFFVKAFWGIVIFCVVMIIYLPR
ncbi:MAG: DnrP protein [Gammaproteobacteria bacterium]|nr:MAG: DnrP protein [Gammaproteobacteria bacterium]